MEYLLKEFAVIKKEFKMLADREEKFNIFSALHKEHDERRLHSRFISVMLQPKGKHGHKESFLNIFLSHLEDECSLIFKPASTLVYPKEYDKKENNNIDILIIDKDTRSAIIIENKIYAGDSITSSGGQIERYLDHVIKDREIPKENVCLIYLTLDGHGPSEESVGKEYKNYKNIHSLSYTSLIIPWLEECLTKVSSEPFLRESLLQYVKLIKQMTGNTTSSEEALKYKDVIASSKSTMEGAKSLIDNFKHVKWHAVHEFWEKLLTKIIDQEYKVLKSFLDNSITDITHYEKYRVGQTRKQYISISFSVSEDIVLSIIFSAHYGHFYFGFSNSSKGNEKYDSLFKRIIDSNSGIYSSTSWMFLHKIFNKDIQFNNFSRNITFSLIESEKQDELIEATWCEVESLIKAVKEEIAIEKNKLIHK